LETQTEVELVTVIQKWTSLTPQYAVSQIVGERIEQLIKFQIIDDYL
jgi:hypothetical protein